MIKIGSVDISTPLFLAPMAGYTGFAYREMIRRFGGCGLLATEMVNARSFIQIEKNLRKSPPRLWGIPTEPRPLAVQIWDNVPENLAQVGNVLAHLWNVSIIDMNFGCPSPTVAQRAMSGSYLLDYPEKVEELVRMTVEACAPVPVTIKMRLGRVPERITAIEVAHAAQEAGAAAIYVHGRTAQQGYSGQADWNWIARVKEAIRGIPVIGNGDVKTPEQARDNLLNYGVDGIMVGRASQGKPWIFSQMAAAIKGEPVPPDPDKTTRKRLILDHLAILEESLPERDCILEMRKIGCRYADGLPNAKQFRARMARVNTPDDFQTILQEEM